MASGSPVVATRVGGLPDLIADGETGYLVPPQNPEELADAILQVLCDPDVAIRMGRVAQDIAKKRFNIERLLSDIENLYQEIFTQKGFTLSN
jgi:glycosyltransferase involved in cell wall biosynthesis